MLLTIHNLPPYARYTDVKALLQEKCNLTELILDNLTNEGNTKKVTVGLANEADAALLVRKVNGLYINGVSLYVEDKTKSRDSDQPYRSISSFQNNAHYEQPVATPQATMMPDYGMSNTMPGYGMTGLNNMNPMVMNYNMPGMYMPMVNSSNMPYMVYGGGQQPMLAMEEPIQQLPVQNEPEFSRYQEEDSRRNDSRKYGRDSFHNRDDKRRSSPKRPTESFNRSTQHERSPPRHRRESVPAARPPLQAPERSGQATRWDVTREPEQDLRPRNDPNPRWEEPVQGWQKPNQGWQEPNQERPEPNHGWQEPNQGWQEPNQDWQEPNQGMQEPNQGWQEPNQDWQEPNERWEERNQSWDGPNQPWEHENPPHGDRGFNRPNRFKPNDHYKNDHSSAQLPREPNFQDRKRGPSNDVNRRPQGPNADWKIKKGHKDVNLNQNNWNNGEGLGRRSNRPSRPDPMPSNSNAFQGNQSNKHRSDEFPNPKRSHNDMRGTENRNQIANDYPAPKRFKEGYNKRSSFDNPRPQTFVSNELDTRPQKPHSWTRMINIDQTSRGQAAAMIAKQAIPATLSQTSDEISYGIILKELKQCIRARIDVLFGEELSSSFQEVFTRYRSQYSRKTDKQTCHTIRRKCMEEKAAQQGNDPNAAVKEGADDSGTLEESEPDDENVEEDGVNTEKSFKAQFKETKKKMLRLTTPLSNKQKVQEEKRQRELEFSKDDLFSLDPATAKALDEEVDALAKIFVGDCEPEAGDSLDETASKLVSERSLDEFKKVVRLRVTKRILNVTSGLCVRILSPVRLPKTPALEEYLQSKGFSPSEVILNKCKKATSYVVTFNNFEDYDRLVRLEKDTIDDVPILFKPMHLCAPDKKITKDQIEQKRKLFIKKQIEPINEPDHSEAQNLNLDDMVVLDTLKTEDADDLPKADEIEDATKADETEDVTKADETEYAAISEETEDDLEANETGDDPNTDDAEHFPNAVIDEDINIGDINDEDLEDF